MINKHLILLLALIWAPFTMAQTPKWLDKAKRAVCTVMTYDQKGTLLHTTNGTFVGEGGIAISDYTSFVGAKSAIFVTTEGQKLPVECVIGVNAMYDVVKLRVTTDKNISALSVARTPTVVNDKIWLLPYSSKKERLYATGSVTEVGKAGTDYTYYTLQLPLNDKQVSCPIVNANGEIIGITQKAAENKSNNQTSYAIGIGLPMSLEVNIMGFNDKDLRAIGLRKALPEKEDQALVYLYMASSSTSKETYKAMLDDFIRQFPNSKDGYLRRAAQHIDEAVNHPAALDLAEADLAQAQALSDNQADFHYNKARLIHNFILQSNKHDQPKWTAQEALNEIRAARLESAQPVYDDLEGDICFMLKDYTGAYAAYQKVAHSSISTADTYFKMAKARQIGGADLKEAIVLMDSCINKLRKPYTEADAGYLLERAQMHMDLEQYRAAMLDYDEYYYAVNGKVNDVFYHYREQASLGARQYQRALDDINKAIEMAPANPLYQLELGAINLRVGRTDEALKALQKSIAIAPSGDAYRLLGMTYVQLKQNDKACEYFEKAKVLGDTLVDSLIEKYCK